MRHHFRLSFRFCFLLTLFLSAALVSPTSAKVIFVAQSGDDSTGDSWSTAYQTIGNAFINAVTGDTLWIKSGTYVENLITKVPMTILGGFEGIEELDNENSGDAKKHITTIDGDHKGRVLEVHHDVRVDCLSITNGTGDGAGIWVRTASIELRDVVVYNNGLTTVRLKVE